MRLQPNKFSITGQVGQESNLQPAVLEHSAQCPDASRVVQIALAKDFAVESSKAVQERPASM
jgi:hypothetical protein